MNPKPKKLWAARVSILGLVSHYPIRVTYVAEMDSYFDESNDIYLPSVGIQTLGGYTVFSSESKKEVKNFIAGAEAVMNVLRSFSEKVVE